MLLVASSGNAVSSASGQQIGPVYPAAFSKRVYSVGAMLPDGSPWDDWTLASTYCGGHSDCFASNFGDWLDIIAPGGRLIFTTRNSGGPDLYYNLDNCSPNPADRNPNTLAFGGTSAAAPFVSGVASLLSTSVPGRNLLGEDIE